MGKARFRGPGGIGGRDPADDLNREAAVRAGCGHSAVDILGHVKEAPEPGGDLPARAEGLQRGGMARHAPQHLHQLAAVPHADADRPEIIQNRSEEHTSELQSLMRNSYAVFCLKKKNPSSNDLPY